MNYMFERSAMTGDSPGSPWQSEVTRKIFAGENVPTQYDMQEHASWHCSLDAGIGLACDLAYCSHNFCELGDGYLGHGSECD
mmetsp:Transcript_38681/g.82278  ORF Transcript_38681/g.82278 Transcript_38681/m.82278 type:complete len:82 (+) Transcript_38681:756-1001(+)